MSERGYSMKQTKGRKAGNNNKAKLPEIPKAIKSDGLDVEYSEELADSEDIEAIKLPMR